MVTWLKYELIRMKPFHTIAVPHKDIMDGIVFANDLWEV